MGCCDIKTRGIYDGEVSSTGYVVYEVLYTLERWCRWGSILDTETVDGVHKMQAGILHDMEEFSNT